MSMRMATSGGWQHGGGGITVQDSWAGARRLKVDEALDGRHPATNEHSIPTAFSQNIEYSFHQIDEQAMASYKQRDQPIGAIL